MTAHHTRKMSSAALQSSSPKSSRKAHPLLKIENLKVYYRGKTGSVPFLTKGSGKAVRAVDGVSLTMNEGETLGVVGESGCGKSTLVRAIMGLEPVHSGSLQVCGHDLTGNHLPKAARLDYQMVFQDPYASLDPTMTVSRILGEALKKRYPKAGREETAQKTKSLLERVGLDAKTDSERYPHEFSGGQRQRIAIARAIATTPRLLIADEAVSALDVSVQSQVLNLLATLKEEDNMGMLFISHDLSVVAHVADRIAVMYLGRIVECGPAEQIMANPLHMYTKALISASPLPDPTLQKSRTRILLNGEPPSASHPPRGCAFAWRSPIKTDAETASTPGLFAEASPEHWVEIHPATVTEESLLKKWKEWRQSLNVHKHVTS